MTGSPRIFVLSAPSAAGKDTLLNRVLAVAPGLKRCVTYTTRARRPGEIEGADYHFVDRAEFDAMRESGAFLEWAEVYGNLYGNSREWLADRLRAGDTVLFRIDVQGALTIRRLYPEAVLIFVAPPSPEEQERRLRARKSESESEIERRLDASDWELSRIPEFDYLIVNDDLDRAVDQIRCILSAEASRVRPVPPTPE